MSHFIVKDIQNATAAGIGKSSNDIAMKVAIRTGEMPVKL